MHGLSLVEASGGHSSSRCAGLSPSRPLFLRSTGSRRAGSAIVAHGPSCSAARGILPDQGSNPCALHWQADSQSLRHQGSPLPFFLLKCGWNPEGERERVSYKIMKTSRESRLALSMYKIYITCELCILWKSTFK